MTIVVLISCWTVRGHEMRPAFLRVEAIASEPSSDNIGKTYDVLWKRPLDADGVRLMPVFPDYCAETATALDEVVGSLIVRHFRLNCSQGLTGGTISIAGLELAVTEVMLHLTSKDGKTLSYLLKPSNPSVVIRNGSTTVFGYLRLGIEHLLYGVDHILFVVALMFFLSRLSELIKTITAFTVAHSITLTLSALEWVYLPQKPVEAMIALSVLFLAVEKLRENPSLSHRDSIVHEQTWVVAFAFGLLHGFGFAGALADIGLPKGNLISALFLFNFGVELGQLFVIAIGIGLAWFVRRVWNSIPEYVVRVPLYLVGVTAAYWVIERGVGIVL